MNLLYLDIDGVLNRHIFNARAQSCDIEQPCVDQLNRIIDATDCKFVISSAWRYMVLGGAMTVRGFEYMLRTHRLHITDRILGTTCADSDNERPCRWWCIMQSRNEMKGVTRWCILDDEVACFEEDADWSRIILCDGKKGLTAEVADRVIERLSA